MTPSDYHLLIIGLDPVPRAGRHIKKAMHIY